MYNSKITKNKAQPSIVPPKYLHRNSNFKIGHPNWLNPTTLNSDLIESCQEFPYNVFKGRLPIKPARVVPNLFYHVGHVWKFRGCAKWQLKSWDKNLSTLTTELSEIFMATRQNSVSFVFGNVHIVSPHPQSMKTFPAKNFLPELNSPTVRAFWRNPNLNRYSNPTWSLLNKVLHKTQNGLRNHEFLN